MAENPVKKNLRLFLAIPLEEVFEQQIHTILDFCHRKIPNVKWIIPSQAHLTLHFLGTTPADQIPRIDEAMKEIVPSTAPIGVTLNGIGGFPNLRKPNVIWLGVRDETGQLLLLYQKIQNAIRQLGFEAEARPFHPHVTLGRVKRACGNLELLANQFGSLESSSGKTLNRFVLYQSLCLPEGARYEVIKSYLFHNAETKT